MQKPLYVTACFHSNRESVTDMIALLKEIITNTLTLEPGCISYSYLQSTDDETLFTSLEIWQDATAESAHWQTEHLKSSLAKLPQLLNGRPNIHKWHRI